MFGTPVSRPSQATVLPFVWTYLMKDGTTKKARGTCNGGKRYGTHTCSHLCIMRRTTRSTHFLEPSRSTWNDSNWRRCRQCLRRGSTPDPTILHGCR
jgi:hypothetical protein